ncbi:MAG: DNA mismatch repair endonuclease MutL [Bacilli bacterium]|nr:DNA mismatch repair endonuclease MutL [Bacilli bacterium]
MGNIIRLDQHTTNLIAAGEVIERASSVVKELVENSIDAKSSTINISLTDSGLKEIIVSDNGTGMDAVDAKLALEPHATSKISKPNDLFNITTLGFRGEALPSIVAVSNFKLKTCAEGTRGLMIVLKGGEIISEAVVAHPHGTEISVRNLFFNTPARLQNLKSESLELSYIIDYVNKMALANPDIAFKLTNNDKTILKTYGSGNLLEVISNIYGADIAKNMLEIEGRDGYFHISGFSSNISCSRSTRNSITIIVNGRVVRNNNIINAVCEAYKNLFTVGRYPIGVINIEVDTSLVDVNVHPAKLEVRFSNEEGLIKLIIETITNLLSKTDLSVDLGDQLKNVFEVEVDTKPEIKKVASYIDDYNKEIFTSKLPSKDDEEIDDDVLLKEPLKEIVKENYSQKQYTFTRFDEEEEKEQDNKSRLPKLDYIGQLFGTYLLTQGGEFFYLIDQHAANERVNYEKILKNLKNDDVTTYELLIPIKLVFTSNEAILIEDKLSEIRRLGITLEEFGGGTYTVREIPYWIRKGNEKEYVEEIIFQIINNRKQEKYQFLDSLAKSLACKKSVKANEYLGRDEVDYIINELSNCENPFTCPHGRPVIVKFSKYEIEKWFKRIV